MIKADFSPSFNPPFFLKKIIKMLNVRPVIKQSSYFVCVQGMLYPIFLRFIKNFIFISFRGIICI